MNNQICPTVKHLSTVAAMHVLHKILGISHKHNSLLLGLIQPSAEELRDIPIQSQRKCLTESVPGKGSFTLARIQQWTVAFPQRERKFSISVLTQSTVESADCCDECEEALKDAKYTANETVLEGVLSIEPWLKWCSWHTFRVKWPAGCLIFKSSSLYLQCRNGGYQYCVHELPLPYLPIVQNYIFYIQ